MWHKAIYCCIGMISRIIIQRTHFLYERVYFFSLQFFATGVGERQIIKAYANHTMLIPPRMVYLVVSKISNHFCRLRPKLISVPKNSTAIINGRTLTEVFFEILKFSGSSRSSMTSTTQSIHFSSISCLGVYYDRW